MGPEDRVLELLPLIQASGSGTLGRAGELLHYRNEQKHRIHQNRPDPVRNATADIDDVLACVAANTGLSFEQVANPSKAQLADIYSRFVNMVDDMEVACFRLHQAGDNRPLSRIGEQVRHCVRCHQSFTIWRNGNEACKVKHDKRLWVQEGEHCVDEIAFVWPCTGDIQWCEFDDVIEKHEYCFVGSHTSDPSNVFYSDDIWEETDGLSHYGDVSSSDGQEPVFRTFPTCKQAGCNPPEEHLPPKKKKKSKPKKEGDILL